VCKDIQNGEFIRAKTVVGKTGYKCKTWVGRTAVGKEFANLNVTLSNDL
jgi:hypothetical protein